MRKGNRTFDAVVISRFNVRFFSYSTPTPPGILFFFMKQIYVAQREWHGRRQVAVVQHRTQLTAFEKHTLSCCHPFGMQLKFDYKITVTIFTKGKHFSLTARHSPSNTNDREVRSILNYSLNGTNAYSVPSCAIRTTNSVLTFTNNYMIQNLTSKGIWRIFMTYIHWLHDYFPLL